MEQGGGKAQGR